MRKEGFSLKKTIISLLLVMTFILSISVSVFAGNDDNPRSIVNVTAEQSISK